jgi:hypothetical protein
MRRLVLLVAALACACDDYEASKADDVIKALQVCPDGGPCATVADGFSLTAVRLCTIPEHRKDGLEATVQLSAGAWQFGATDADKTTAKFSLEAEECVTGAFEAPKTAQTVTIRGEIEGYVKTTEKIFGAARPEDVIPTLEICPPGQACSAFAGAAGETAVLVCTVDTARPTDVKATLRVTGGQWLGAGAADASTTEVDLAAQPCALASLMMPARPAVIRVRAELAGFSRDRELRVEAMDLADVLLSVTAPVAADTTAPIGVSARLVGAVGDASLGTRVEFEVVNVTPTDAVAYFTAPSAILDEGDTVTTQLARSSTLQTVEIRATATPQPLAGDPDPPAELARTFLITAVP